MRGRTEANRFTNQQNKYRLSGRLLANRSRGALLLAFLLCLVWPEVASGHATLKQSLPLPDSVLEEPHMLVQLTFTEEVEAEFGAIAVYDHTGRRVDKGDAALDPRDVTRVLATLKPLDDGGYTVVWSSAQTGTRSQARMGSSLVRGWRGHVITSPNYRTPTVCLPFRSPSDPG